MKTAFLAAGVIALSVSVSAAQDYSTPYTSYFAFGDSLTDDGKFGPDSLPPPSLEGRFSNGQTYAEQIAADFAATGRFSFNFALGGATAEDDNDNIAFYPAAAQPFATFGSQIQTFANLIPPSVTGDSPLISVLFGGNDLLQDLGDAFGGVQVGANAADAVKAGIETLAALDPKFDTFVVGNIGDLGATPLFTALGGPLQTLASAESAAFAAQLDANNDMLRNAGLTIIDFDLGGLIQGIADDPARLGITNTAGSCIESFNAIPVTTCISLDPATGLPFVDDDGNFVLDEADAFIFADNIHPSGVVQTAAATEFRNSVAAVPLPAGLPLLLTALAAFGILRMRRAA